ncbi:GerMN domain-containing protein [Paenibacillus sp. HN-1]|uniref:GerMN domain-containing protein n=1 Tax=Paenibacillus TaxID=44249 RepID=UPI001CA8E391|nr:MULTISPECIES: GerMN domain-containing protein [Paenibacillus]MBY9078594.1 GerMN domain-containing protein [Paenibacillus sp. CGMCC 1.18879]MBY9084130.1 GerMN domain-containing protein [Paenibacillus sinensis]
MNNKHKLASVSAACLLALPLALSGCGWFGGDSSAAIDPPPGDVEAQMLQSTDKTLDAGVMAPVSDSDIAAADTGSSGSDQAAAGEDAANSAAAGAGSAGAASTKTGAERTTVYLQNDSGLLAPMALDLAQANKDDALKQSLEALVQGGDSASSLPEGFSGVLPQGTKINSVKVENGVATVDFGGSFGSYAPADERKLLEAVTWTLTGQKGVQSVQLSMDGKKLSEMPLKGTPLDRPLTRSIGINLPAQGPSVMNSSAVTVFFSAASPSGVQYYVPVTKFVTPGQDRLKAAMNELIAGPESQDGLETVMTSDTVLDSITEDQSGVVTVSLKDDMFDDGSQVPAELLESVVLTASLNSDNAMVQVRMNGKQTVTGTDNVDYGKPVSAPQVINELPL